MVEFLASQSYHTFQSFNNLHFLGLAFFHSKVLFLLNKISTLFLNVCMLYSVATVAMSEDKVPSSYMIPSKSILQVCSKILQVCCKVLHNLQDFWNILISKIFKVKILQEILYSCKNLNFLARKNIILQDLLTSCKILFSLWFSCKISFKHYLHAWFNYSFLQDFLI